MLPGALYTNTEGLQPRYCVCPCFLQCLVTIFAKTANPPPSTRSIPRGRDSATSARFHVCSAPLPRPYQQRSAPQGLLGIRPGRVAQGTAGTWSRTAGSCSDQAARTGRDSPPSSSSCQAASRIQLITGGSGPAPGQGRPRFSLAAPPALPWAGSARKVWPPPRSCTGPGPAPRSPPRPVCAAPSPARTE